MKRSICVIGLLWGFAELKMRSTLYAVWEIVLVLKAYKRAVMVYDPELARGKKKVALRRWYCEDPVVWGEEERAISPAQIGAFPWGGFRPVHTWGSLLLWRAALRLSNTLRDRPGPVTVHPLALWLSNQPRWAGPEKQAPPLLPKWPKDIFS